ncbi:NAD-dependent epimerase/dehydratase family protein [Pseudonocardia kunmingensis]|uniref:Nucleoside-diphosphate-sugar epimerase n=1 Tax=Pseudonocardia kunmingensis TaxID=630975 RepID=A0A543D0P1_9PSEU|nr:NAD-dependent epimerase/dehydratase family protein [Pseudonocardia kunmingensis]TQM02916.1 nucleoside-diphosphate-sugar epimerase [Pseudonocardia kunmingensis]
MNDLTRAPADEPALEEFLSRPAPGVAEALDGAGGDVVLLGAGGKIGPSLARMARRALDDAGSDARVVAVSRFSDAAVRAGLEDAGVRTVAADLADPGAYAGLPDAAAVFHLAAMKFGTTGQEQQTWWSNAAIPALVAARYRGVPTVVYSTGNVYPLVPLTAGGAVESDPPAPVGEYAQSCLARERIFTHGAHAWGTPTAVFRLNYACELRYGVIADIAVKLAAGEPVDVTMPAVNVAWQGDVNAWALRSLTLAGVPPHVLNATGPETVPVRRLAVLLAERMGVTPEFRGVESSDALLNDAGECHERFGYPTVPLRRLVDWVADWVGRGGRQLGKATKFQQREGRF